MFVLIRTDGRGGYATPPGSSSSYTRDLLKARRYSTKEEAEADRCVENERIANFHDLLESGHKHL